MKYQKIYDALQTGGARIDLDQSGWRVKSSGHWIAGQRPLWLVAEVPRLHLRMWVTHEFGTLSVTTANSALPIDSRAYHESHTRRTFQNQREMAEYLGGSTVPEGGGSMKLSFSTVLVAAPGGEVLTYWESRASGRNMTSGS